MRAAVRVESNGPVASFASIPFDVRYVGRRPRLLIVDRPKHGLSFFEVTGDASQRSIIPFDLHMCLPRFGRNPVGC